jgi:uncharacterized protein involved in exopolysaccharide biosynthesis
MTKENLHVRAPNQSLSTSDADEISLVEIILTLKRNTRLLLLGPLAVAVVTLGITFLIPPTFTASAQIMSPQQQSGAAALLGSMTGLSSLAGAAGLKNPADQWVGLLRSRTVADGLIERFKLKDYYEKEFMFQTRAKLEDSSKITAGKDGLIDIQVTDRDPKLSADIANAYIEELQKLTKTLAVSEAAQRRVFFEEQLNETKNKLIQAETVLRASGVNTSTLKINPDSAVASVAQLQAQIAAAQVSLSVMRESMTSDSPAVRQANAELAALRAQLRQAEQIDKSAAEGAGGSYVQSFREFKYYETLFELMARQYELAKADEAKDGALIQVVDAAETPEWKSAPKRGLITALSYLIAVFLFVFYALIKPSWEQFKLVIKDTAHPQ